MRPTWRIHETLKPANTWRDKQILIAFNGPQLVLVGGSDGDYLSVAAGEDERAVRWLRSPISKNELEALLAGSTTVRECILKPNVWVVDVNSSTGEVLMEAKVTPDDLSGDNLPAVDSHLPEVVTNRRPL